MSKDNPIQGVFSPAIHFSDEELTALMQAMKNRYGLDFTNYEKSSLKRGIIRLMMKNNMTSSLELWSKVLKDREFFINAIDDLLVNLTELFRNPDVWLKIRQDILPKFDGKPLNIWHAGCSTGEEVYTMGIVLDEHRVLERSSVLATDLSSTALKKAEIGEYSLLLLEQYLTPFMKFYSNRRLEDYFNFRQTHATIKPRYQRQVTFKRHNLVHDGMNQKFDIIFCRNVMIYFDETLKLKVLNLLKDSLRPGGYLIIGYYDIMPDAGKKMFDLYDVKTRIYKNRN